MKSVTKVPATTVPPVSVCPGVMTPEVREVTVMWCLKWSRESAMAPNVAVAVAPVPLPPMETVGVVVYAHPGRAKASL